MSPRFYLRIITLKSRVQGPINLDSLEEIALQLSRPNLEAADVLQANLKLYRLIT